VCRDMCAHQFTTSCALAMPLAAQRVRAQARVQVERDHSAVDSLPLGISIRTCSVDEHVADLLFCIAIKAKGDALVELINQEHKTFGSWNLDSISTSLVGR
jgi:hypothetical protein